MWSLYLMAIVVGWNPGLVEGACKYKTPCACATDDGKVIDIESLGTLKVTDTSLNNEYIYKPCKNFDIRTLKGVTFVQHAQSTGKYYEVGSDPKVTFVQETGGDSVQLTISANHDPSNKRKANVLLVCSQGNTKFTFSNEAPQLSYNFVLNSPSCCARVPSPGGGSGSLSVGTVLIIIFFVLLILYIIIGTLFMTHARHAQGMERIPNSSFWSALPGLIKDGFRFTMTCGSRSTTYNQI